MHACDARVNDRLQQQLELEVQATEEQLEQLDLEVQAICKARRRSQVYTKRQFRPTFRR